MKIQRLSAHLINQIAAGEVIERPASVVKELVENCLDAGAKSILIELDEGGNKLIRVTDDGVGISLEDLPLAFASHATSKLSSAEHLKEIESLGFRGEALASIGAVSRAKIISRTPDTALGGLIENLGGKISAAREAGAPFGTSVEVRDLFFNLPARRKFLKRAPVELSRIIDLLTRISLPFEGVEFTVKHDDKLVFHVPGSMDLQERIRNAFGKETAEALVGVKAVQSFAQLHGYVGLPSISRSDTNRQFFYLNGRLIRDRALMRALREAYRELLPFGRQPVAFLFFGIDPKRVDQNVHPTKIEARFQDERQLFPFLLHAVKDALSQTDLATPGKVLTPVRPISSAYKPYASWTASVAGNSLLKEAAVMQTTSLFEKAVAQSKYLQIHRSYIVREIPEGLEIIDQHALHERVLFEELKQQAQEQGIAVQKLLVPELVELARTDVVLVENQKELLQRAGFEAEAFGETTVSIRSIPARLRNVDMPALMEELVAVMRGEFDTSKHDFFAEILHRAACRAAIMAGDDLEAAEIDKLLEKAGDLSSDQTCPHARPTRVRFTLAELEKAFHRS